ncbi:MAG: sulfur carrier protein ThiS [Bacteroidota bacterium]
MSTEPSHQRVYINGQEREVTVGQSLADALHATMDIDPLYAKGVAVAVNDKVIRREDWKDVFLEPEDRVEVITAQQGG